MSPTEAVRNRALQFLSDQATGLNAEFTRQCVARGIPIPVPGMGGTDAEPFNFGQDSQNVFTMRTDIAFLESTGVQVQYPLLLVYGTSSIATGAANKINWIPWQGDVNLEIVIWLGWLLSETPRNNDYETPVDAVEESLINILNSDVTAWNTDHPILYRNILSARERFPVQKAAGGEIQRTGIRMGLTALYLMQ